MPNIDPAIIAFAQLAASIHEANHATFRWYEENKKALSLPDMPLPTPELAIEEAKSWIVRSVPLVIEKD
jgi:hypothetical protein